MLFAKFVRSYVIGILGGTFYVISRFLGSKELIGYEFGTLYDTEEGF